MDKEIVIKGCENWINNHKGENFLLTYSSVVELLAILKERDANLYKCPNCGTWVSAENVIRCKECIFPKNGICHNPKTFGAIVKDDWFCADGKRRDHTMDN